MYSSKSSEGPRALSVHDDAQSVGAARGPLRVATVRATGLPAPVTKTPSLPLSSGPQHRLWPLTRSAAEARRERDARSVAPATDVLRVGVGRAARPGSRGVVGDAKAPVVLPPIAVEQARGRAQHLQARPGVLAGDVRGHRVRRSMDLQPRLPVARGAVSVHRRAQPLDL